MSKAQELADALDRMDNLLNPEYGLLSVPGDSATAVASRADMALIRSALSAISGQQAAPRVQWWLATIDRYGNPTLTDGAHGDRAGADRAAYLIDALGVGQGKNYAVARVELSEPKPNADGVNQEAVAQCNLAARASNGGKA